jgi:hypothetical protein
MLWVATVAVSILVLLDVWQNSLPLTYFTLGALAAYSVYGMCYGIYYGRNLWLSRKASNAR